MLTYFMIIFKYIIFILFNMNAFFKQFNTNVLYGIICLSDIKGFKINLSFNNDKFYYII